jgi:hypothetical protein
MGKVIKTATVCCAKCGGLNVEYTVWFNPNTEEVGEAFGSWNAGDNTFCADCEENTDLVDYGSDPDHFKLARAARKAGTP